MIDELIARARRIKNSDELLRPLFTVRGDLYASTLRVEEAEENYREALSLTQQPAVRAHIVLHLATSLVERNRAAEALGLCDAITADLSTQTYLLLSAQLSVVYAQAHLALSHLDAAQLAADHSLALAEQLCPGTPREASSVEAQAHMVRGILFNIRGNAREATHEWQSAVSAAREANLKSIEVRCQMYLGIVAYQQGDWANALHHYQAALLGARALDDSNIAARVWSNIAIVQHIRGELDAALEAAAEARHLKEKMGDFIGAANADNTRANILLALEQYDQARAICENTIYVAETGHAERLLGGYLDTLALIQLAQEQPAEALATLRRILGLPGAREDASLIHDVHCHLALALLAHDEADAAEREWTALAQSNDPRHVIEQNLVEGWLNRAHGDYGAAQDCLLRARQKVALSGYALYENGVKRLEQDLQNPLQTAHLRL